MPLAKKRGPVPARRASIRRKGLGQPSWCPQSNKAKPSQANHTDNSYVQLEAVQPATKIILNNHNEEDGQKTSLFGRIKSNLDSN